MKNSTTITITIPCDGYTETSELTFVSGSAVWDGERVPALFLHDNMDEFSDGDCVFFGDWDLPVNEDDVHILMEETWISDYEVLDSFIPSDKEGEGSDDFNVIEVEIGDRECFLVPCTAELEKERLAAVYVVEYGMNFVPYSNSPDGYWEVDRGMATDYVIFCNRDEIPITEEDARQFLSDDWNLETDCDILESVRFPGGSTPRDLYL